MSDNLLIIAMAEAIYKSNKGYISDMQQCKRAAKHALKALRKYELSNKDLAE